LDDCLYKIDGSGPPVVLIPGFASKINSWGFQYRWLKRFFKVITVENRAGLSGSADATAAMTHAASELEKLLRSLAVENPVLVGSSMGGMIALEFIRQYPEKSGGLVLASFPFEHSPLFQDLADDLAAMADDADESLFFEKLIPLFFSSSFIEQDRFRIFAEFFRANGTSFSKTILRAQLKAAFSWRYLENWMEICSCPCLMIYGSDDQVVLKESVHRTVSAKFRPSELKIIQGAGHAVHIEKFQEFNGILYDFLRRSAQAVPAAL